MQQLYSDGLVYLKLLGVVIGHLKGAYILALPRLA